MEVIGDADSVEDHAERNEETTGDEQIEGMFRFGDTTVATSQSDGKHVANLSTVVATMIMLVF